MKSTIAVKLGCVVAVLTMTAAAFAQGPGGSMGMQPGFGGHRPPMERAMGPHGDHGRWWNNPRIVEKLKLTDDQRKAMDGILLQHRETLIDLRASLQKAELTMEPLMQDDQPNEGKILAQIDKVAAARAELEKANARFLLALRGKLTPDQWKQMQDFRKEGGMPEGGMHREGMGQGGPGGQGRGGWNRGGQGPNGMHGQPPPPTPPGAPQSMVDPSAGLDAPPASGAAQ